MPKGVGDVWRRALQWLHLDNERGQLNLLPIGNQLLRAGTQAAIKRLLPSINLPGFAPQRQPLSGLFQPQNLLGAGLLTAGALQREPGEITEARQFLRNRFTSPTALSEQFAGQLGGLAQQFQPLLTQQRQRGIADIAQRFKAAFPGTVGAQGPEFGGLERFLTEQALPREQAFLGGLGLDLLGAQERAATSLLANQQPNFLAQGLGQLGGALLQGQGGQGQGILGTDGASLLPGIGPGGGFQGGLPGFQQAASGLLQAATQAGGLSALLSVNPQLIGQVSSILGAQIVPDLAGALTGIPGFAIQTSQGLLIPADAVNLATIGAAPPGLLPSAISSSLPGGIAGIPGATPGGIGAGGAASFSLLGAVGTGAAGFGVGNLIGRQFASGSATRAASGLTGAAGGAATGAAIGSVIPGVGTAIGAVIGAIAGGIGGLFGSSSAESARKAASIEAEAQQTGEARPSVLAQARAFAPLATQAEQQLRGLGAFAGRGLWNDAVHNGLDAALKAGDPQALAFYNELNAINTHWWTPMLKPILAGPPSAQKAFDYIGQNLTLGGFFDESSPGALGPETPLSLITSSETGKFGPGADMLTDAITRFDTVSGILQRIVARYGGG